MKKLILILIALVVGGVLILNVGANVTAFAVTCYDQCDIDHDDCIYRCNDGDANCVLYCVQERSDCLCQCDGYTSYDGLDCY